jgi:hypothetical protein
MPLKIPEYQRQVEGVQGVAAKGVSITPTPEASGMNVVNAIGGAGKQLEQVGLEATKIFNQIDAKNKKDKILIATNNIANEMKLFEADLSTRSDYENFDALRDEHIKNSQQKLKDSLGDDLFEKYMAVEGNTIYNSFSTDVDILKIGSAQKKENENLKIQIDQNAYTYAESNDKMKPVILKNQLDTIDSSNQNGKIKEGLKRDTIVNFSKSEIELGLRNNPESVVSSIKNKKYQGILSIEEENKYLKEAETIIKANEGTTNETAVNDAFTKMLGIAQVSQSSFYKELEFIVNSPNDAMKKYNVNAKQYLTLVNNVKSIAENKLSNFATNSVIQRNDIESQYKLFQINKQGRIENEDLDNFESMSNFIDKAETAMSSSLASDRNIISKQVNNMYSVMGQSIIEEKYGLKTEADNFKFRLNRKAPFIISMTNNFKIKDTLKKELINTGYLDKFNMDFNGITQAEVGYIYKGAYDYAVKNGIDLNATNPKDDIKIKTAVNNSLVDYMMLKYGLSKDKVQAMIDGNKMIVLTNNEKKKQEKADLEKYQ